MYSSKIICNSVSKFTPSFLAAINESSRICFGNLPIVNYRTGYKLLKQKPIGPLAINHYLPDMTRPFRNMTDDFNTEIEERRMEALNRLKRRGKGPPKKGQGKRATKKK